MIKYNEYKDHTYRILLVKVIKQLAIWQFNSMITLLTICKKNEFILSCIYNMLSDFFYYFCV
jgi:hypothetical protein